MLPNRANGLSRSASDLGRLGKTCCRHIIALELIIHGFLVAFGALWRSLEWIGVKRVDHFAVKVVWVSSVGANEMVEVQTRASFVLRKQAIQVKKHLPSPVFLQAIWES